MKQFSIHSPMNVECNLFRRMKGAFLLSAVGDGLGWPLEFVRRKPAKPVEQFITWKKKVGGKWWGYTDEISAGEYSDDTQLMLSIARSIDMSSRFNPEYFAYLEFPLWLNYERGGGRSIKTAARNILRQKTRWNSNFYRTNMVEYSDAGANGAAMRNFPIAAMNYDNDRNFVVDSFKNAIITHGHPRAIIGSLLIGASQIHSMVVDKFQFADFTDRLTNILDQSLEVVHSDESLTEWLNAERNIGFVSKYKSICGEAKEFIRALPKYLRQNDSEYYRFTKARQQKYKSSGTTTAAVAIYMFLKYMTDPERALLSAVNMVGSDTDTIGSFVGSLIGAYYGHRTLPKKLFRLTENLQDRGYFEKIAEYLWLVKTGKLNIESGSQKLQKNEALLRILAWQIGLHEMFWDALAEGCRVTHPTLGSGTIVKKSIKPLTRQDYVAKIFKIEFDVGQTAYFHSRVSKNGDVRESLARQITRTLTK